jgi:uncharacterized SAM-binding protein YcdF (DUF218 family)
MPLTLAFLWLAAALIIVRVRPGRWSRIGVCVGLVALFLSAHPLTAWVLLRELELEELADAPDTPRAGAIVILGGGMRAGPSGGVGLAEDSTVRVLCGLDLYRRAGIGLVVVSGGASATSPNIPVASLLADRLIAEGVPPAAILVETQSSTTAENGLFTARLLRHRGVARVALVTEALHQARATRVFRKQGLEVVPFSCGSLAASPPALPGSLLPNARAAYLVQRAAHEWVGLAWYWLRGEI